MRRIAAIAATMGASFLIVLAVAGPVSAGSSECELSVTPSHGPPGTEFVFSGSGYTPTLLTLSQEGKETREVELDLGDADPFEIRLIATEDDAGRWVATASVPETECAGRAVIRVTLPPTATAVGDATTGTVPPVILFGIACLVTVFLFATRFFIARLAARV